MEYSTNREMVITKWTVICDFLQCGNLTCVDSNEHMQPPCMLRNSLWCSISSLALRIFKRLEKALIRLRVCAGWSEALLVAHTTLLEISCHGSTYDDITYILWLWTESTTISKRIFKIINFRFSFLIWDMCQNTIGLCNMIWSILLQIGIDDHS